MWRWMTLVVLVLAAMYFANSTRGEDAPAVAPALAPAGEAAANSNTQKDERPVIQVDNTKAFLEAVGSDRIIEMKPGEYNITQHEGLVAAGIVWDGAHDGKQLIFQDLKNLTIRAVGDARARIVIQPRFADVLLLEACENLSFENLVFGHTDVGPCSAGVIKANRCKNLSFTNCELFGCGSEGLTLKQINGLTFTRSEIHGCSNGIMTVSHSRDIRFTDSHFHKNENFWGMVFRHCPTVTFQNCLVEKNSIEPSEWSPSTLFHVEVTNLSFDGILRDNQTPAGDVNDTAKVVVDPKTDAFTITHTATDAKRDAMQKEKRTRKQRIQQILRQMEQLERELQNLLKREEAEASN